jgi:hypothetical protein
MEETNARVFGDGAMQRISRGFHQLVEPATLSASIWRPIATR